MYLDLDCDFQFAGVASTKIQEVEPFWPDVFSPCMKSDMVEVIVSLKI